MDCTNVCLISGYVERNPAIRYREDGIAQCTCTLRVEELGATGTIYKTYVVAEGLRQDRGGSGRAAQRYPGGASGQALLAQAPDQKWRREERAGAAGAESQCTNACACGGPLAMARRRRGGAHT